MMSTEKVSQIPPVEVPHNFGIELLGKSAHDNLIFRLGNGEVLKVNSAIISINSPVIHRLTTELDQTTIDVDYFGKDAILGVFHE